MPCMLSVQQLSESTVSEREMLTTLQAYGQGIQTLVPGVILGHHCVVYNKRGGGVYKHVRGSGNQSNCKRTVDVFLIWTGREVV